MDQRLAALLDELLLLVIRTPGHQHLLLAYNRRRLDGIALADLADVQGRDHGTHVEQIGIDVGLCRPGVHLVHVEGLSVMQDVSAIKILDALVEFL